MTKRILMCMCSQQCLMYRGAISPSNTQHFMCLNALNLCSEPGDLEHHDCHCSGNGTVAYSLEQLSTARQKLKTTGNLRGWSISPDSPPCSPQPVKKGSIPFMTQGLKTWDWEVIAELWPQRAMVKKTAYYLLN